MNINTEKMFELASKARQNAYAPHSKFAVGACVLTEAGQYFVGGNVENACYAMGQCAEASAIGTMIATGARKIRAIMIVADTKVPIFPCGGCLQKISEFATDDTEVICCNLRGAKGERHPFTRLYPMMFGQDALASHHD